MKKKVAAVAMSVLIVATIGTVSGCSKESDKVSDALSQDASNFKMVKKLTVINCVQGDVLFQMTGRMSIAIDTSQNQLAILVENSDGTFQKHFIGLSSSITYTIEQISDENVGAYDYTLDYNPGMWLPSKPITE
jgi:hypothetical protein